MESNRECLTRVEGRWKLPVLVILVGMSLFFRVSHSAEVSELADLAAKIEDRVILDDLFKYAYQANPSITEAREAWQAVIEKYQVVTGYPDPELMVTYFPEPIETRLGPQDWNASISQKIPFPGKLSKAGEIVEKETRIAKLNLDRAVRNMIQLIRESFYELLYIRKAKKVAEENLKLLEHLRKVAETAYAQENSTLLDMIKAQSQNGQLRYDILLLDDLEKTEITILNGLLNRLPGDPIGEIEIETLAPVLFTVNEIYELAENNQEEIQIARMMIEKADKQVELAHYENMPDFNLGIFYGGIGKPNSIMPPHDAGRDSVGIQAMVKIPLWFGKNRSRVDRARAETKGAEAALVTQINDTRTQIRSLFFRLQNSLRLMELYESDLLPQAAKAMEIAETWFQERQSTFSDFIEAQSVWYNFQLALARAQADYGKYLARIERFVGRSITKKDETSNTMKREGEE